MQGRRAEPIGWRGRLHPAPIWAGAGGLLLSDEADRMTTSSRRRALSPYNGRDCAGMLGNYAADYAARELFAARKSELYRIVCRWIAGTSPVTVQGVHHRAPRTRRRARNLKADFRRGHPQPHIDHLRAGFTRDIICLPDRRAYPYRGKPKGKSGTEKKPNQHFQSESAFWKFFYTHGQG